jgi:hypothetical protein
MGHNWIQLVQGGPPCTSLDVDSCAMSHENERWRKAVVLMATHWLTPMPSV